MNTYERIVRELVESSPAVGYQDGRCKFCGAWVGPPREDHESNCLWLRAKQAVEDAPSIAKEITVSEKKEFVSESAGGAWTEETLLYLYADGSVRWQK